MSGQRVLFAPVLATLAHWPTRQALLHLETNGRSTVFALERALADDGIAALPPLSCLSLSPAPVASPYGEVALPLHQLRAGLWGVTSQSTVVGSLSRRYEHASLHRRLPIDALAFLSLPNTSVRGHFVVQVVCTPYTVHEPPPRNWRNPVATATPPLSPLHTTPDRSGL